MRSRMRARSGSNPGPFSKSNHLHEESGCGGIHPSPALAQLNKWRKPSGEPPYQFLISEPRQPAEVSPVGARWIAAEAAGEFLGCLGAQRAIENSPMVQPRLEVSR